MAQNEHVYVSERFGRITGTKEQLEKFRSLLISGCAMATQHMVDFRDNGDDHMADYCWKDYLDLREEYKALDKYLEGMQ